MKKLTLLLAPCLVALATSAFAATQTAKVTRVRHYVSTSEYKLELWFDKDINTSCSRANRAMIRTTNAAQFKVWHRQALAARVSGTPLRVTSNSCDDSLSRLSRLDLMD